MWYLLIIYVCVGRHFRWPSSCPLRLNHRLRLCRAIQPYFEASVCSRSCWEPGCRFWQGLLISKTRCWHNHTRCGLVRKPNNTGLPLHM